VEEINLFQFLYSRRQNAGTSIALLESNQFQMDVLTQQVELKGSRTEEKPAIPLAGCTPSSTFKYYIHDSVATLRFQLIGDLRDGNVTELNGSWETAQTTLRFRRLVLDLCGLNSTDEHGKRWLLKMKDVGAAFLPDEYLEAAAKTSRTMRADGQKPSLAGRMLAIFKPKP
jgi:hypothetical protein